MMREKSSKDFTLAEQRQLATLTPHLKRACDVAGRLARAQAIGVTFEHLPLPVLIVGASGRVSRITPAAQELLALAHGLALENGTLVAEVREDNSRLRQAIVHAARDRLSDCSTGEPVKLRRPRTGRPALLAHVLPCSETGRPFADTAAMAMIFVADPDTRVPVRTGEIERALDLTPAEARLAAVVASGAALKEVAAKLGITYLTARTQLRSVFSKTGVCRQSELVRLIASLEAHRPGPTRA
jgi:DNA-binding CsgD family transcriptional regulator